MGQGGRVKRVGAAVVWAVAGALCACASDPAPKARCRGPWVLLPSAPDSGSTAAPTDVTAPAARVPEVSNER